MFYCMGIFDSFFKPTSISDPIDLLFYVLGTLIYWTIFKKMGSKKAPTT